MKDYAALYQQVDTLAYFLRYFAADNLDHATEQAIDAVTEGEAFIVAALAGSEVRS